MAEDRVDRRLAAILAADIAGYSALMGTDEARTVRDLKGHQVVVLPMVGEFGGRIIDTAGDGILAEFPSVVNAVKCAVAIQSKMAERNDAIELDRRMQFRIGINIGEIIYDQARIYGEGINVAARLENSAEPGGICISSKVYEEISGRIDLAYQDIGDQQLKNIARPVRAYRVHLDSVAPTAAPAPALPDKPSIAVLAFTNMSGDPEQEYFADGISEDIITALSKISQLFVIARNTSFTFKGKAVHAKEVSKSLGVRYILEGSIRKAGNRVRITSQLIDGVTGGHLWAERFDRDLTDIFAVQDEVTREIVSVLALNLTKGEQQRAANEQTDNPEVYDYFLRGREQLRRDTKEGNRHAQEMLQRAVDLDPNFAPAYAFLAHVFLRDYLNQWSELPALSLERAYELASRAVMLDDSDPYAHWALGAIYLWMRRHDEAISEQERAISLNPNFADGHRALGLVLHYSGRSEDAVRCFDRCIALDPYHEDLVLHFQGQAHFQLGRYKKAIGFLKRRLIRNPQTDISRVLLAASYGHLSRIEEARAEWKEVFRINPDYSLLHRRNVLPYKNPADFELLMEGLRKAGLGD